MKKIIISILAVIFFIPAFSQPQMKPNTGLIVGKVLDNANNPVQYVNVFLYKTDDTTVVNAIASDAEGKFLLSNVPYGTYDLKFKFLGFKDKMIKNVEVSKANRFVRIGSVSLNNDDVEVAQVVVQGQTNTVQYKIDKKVINVSKDLMSQGGDATDALRNVPSVNVDVNGDVTIRGSSNFIVMINGKPSILDPNEALKQIPVSNIDHIELITNPSAKYDPDGDAGIINIITKNLGDLGLSGKIEVGADDYLGYNADILLNYKTKKFNFYTEFDTHSRIHPMKISQYREFYAGADTNFMDVTGQSGWEHGDLNGKLGFNYNINKNNSFTIEANIGKRKFGNKGFSAQHLWYSDTTLNQYFYTTSESDVQGLNADGSVDYTHLFNDKGHKIKTFFQYSYFSPIKTDLNVEDTTGSDFTPTNSRINEYRIVEDHRRNRYRFELDYELPLNEKNKIEAGYVFRYIEMGGSYQQDNYDVQNSNWITDSSTFNNMMLYRGINAGYITFSSSSFKWFDYELGLRIEHTNRLITEEVTNSRYPLNRWDFFPTVHLSKKLPLDQQVQLSYSRRINRPHGWNLNPFPRYFDKYTVMVGNPNLAPEYTNSFELNYMKSFGKNNISIETYYKTTDGKIDRIQSIENNIMYMTAANLNKDYSLGTEISANLLLFKMLMANVSGNIFNYRIKGTLDGVPVDKQTMTWNSRIMLMTMLPTGTGIQIGGFYNAPSVTLQGTRQGMFVSFAGIRQSFFKRKVSLTIQARDLFGTMRFAFVNKTDDLYTINDFSAIRPFVGFTLTYRIRNYKEDRRNKPNSSDQNSVDFMGEGAY